MISDDLITMVVPWVVFASGLAVIGWRLAADRIHGRRHRGHGPGPGPGRPDGNGPGTPGA
jgi:hypothetical protein